MELKKAVRKSVKLKMNISAPSGAGKTYSSLLLAYGITNDWSKIAVIDTENGSASLYDHLGEFNTIDLAPPFTPEKYISALDMCEKEGMEVVIIDSSTHEWNCLVEENQLLADTRFRGNSWSAWSVTTPRHDKFISKIVNSRMHVITCTRSKTETIITDDKKVKKIGMKDVQREGWEYEMTISFNLDRDTHFAMVSKDRTGLFKDEKPFLITPETGKKIKEWCEKGIVIPFFDDNGNISEDTQPELNTALVDIESCANLKQLKEVWQKYPKLQKNKEFEQSKNNKKEKLK